MKIAVIIPAAGAGKRFDALRHLDPSSSSSANHPNKIELDLAGKPVFLRATELFLNRPEVVRVILAVNPDTIDQFKFKWGDKLGFHNVQIVRGGKIDRWETVMKALESLDHTCTHAAIHDAARPLTSRATIDRVFDALQAFPAVIPAVPVSATLKQVDLAPPPQPQVADPLDAILGTPPTPKIEIKRIARTIDRANLVEAQTPQAFELQLLRRAYAHIAANPSLTGGITDDASLVEALGEPVYAVEGETTNIKITRPEDMPLAAAILRMRNPIDEASLARKRLFDHDDDS
jgi:2-C-methyl-D-erythritol 4-phosphate cytidylyltransferase